MNPYESPSKESFHDDHDYDWKKSFSAKWLAATATHLVIWAMLILWPGIGIYISKRVNVLIPASVGVWLVILTTLIAYFFTFDGYYLEGAKVGGLLLVLFTLVPAINITSEIIEDSDNLQAN